MSIPPYGKRFGWLPKTLADYGDGGAYPELLVSQYPNEMGRKNTKKLQNSAVALRVNEEGKILYSALAKNHKSSVDHLMPTSEIPQKPSIEEREKVRQKTESAIKSILNGKVRDAHVASHVTASGSKPTYIRYNPADSGESRMIRMQDAPIDPLEPPRFKHKKVPIVNTETPAPILRSPPRKITQEEQRNWTIPPAISNWKNPKGYTIPLDKRLAADGRGLQDVTINDKFANLAEALYVADRHAREEVEKRALLHQKIAKREKEEKEEHLRALAQKAREERSGLVSDNMQEQDTEGQRERDQIRREREREIQRQLRMSHMGADTKKRVEQETKINSRILDRDVSEKIALGMSSGTTNQSKNEIMYDQRLFDQNQGMSSGFKDDDAYAIYDKPLFRGSSASQVYKPKKQNEEEDVNVDEIIESKNRFMPDRGFKGTEGAANEPRDGPVEFEKVDQSVDKFLKETFKESQETKTSPRRSPRKNHRSRSPPRNNYREGKRRRSPS